MLGVTSWRDAWFGDVQTSSSRVNAADVVSVGSDTRQPARYALRCMRHIREPARALRRATQYPDKIEHERGHAKLRLQVSLPLCWRRLTRSDSSSLYLWTVVGVLLVAVVVTGALLGRVIYLRRRFRVALAYSRAHGGPTPTYRNPFVPLAWDSGVRPGVTHPVPKIWDELCLESDGEKALGDVQPAALGKYAWAPRRTPKVPEPPGLGTEVRDALRVWIPRKTKEEAVVCVPAVPEVTHAGAGEDVSVGVLVAMPCEDSKGDEGLEGLGEVALGVVQCRVV